MRMSGVRRGDLVELKGDPVSLWVVVQPPSNGQLRVQPRGRTPTMARTVKSRDVTTLWRKQRTRQKEPS